MLPSRFEKSHSVYQLDHFELDYRAEVMATALLAGDGGAPRLPLAKLLFSPLGPNARPYSRDFKKRQFVTAHDPEHPYQRFDTPREGLYDQLPQHLFHPIRSSPAHDPASDPDQLLEEIKQAQEVEQQTRLFFLPFDTELYYLRVLRYQRERKQDQLERDKVLLAQFAEGWPIIHSLDPFLGRLFVQLLPFIHQLRGDLPWLSRLLHVFLEVPVSIETDRRITHPPLHEPVLALGQCRLGITAMAGNTLDDSYDGITLAVGPVPAARVADFLPKGPAVRLLGQLQDYFMPATAEVVHVITIEPTTAPLGQAQPWYLGYDSYL